MKKIIYILLLSLPLNIFALDQDTAFKAMKDEMARNIQKLQMTGFAKPYFITYTLEDDRQATVLASLGALVSNDETSAKKVYVNMRVGAPQFDNTSFGSPRPAAALAGDGYLSIRSSLWLISDAAYLDALENLSKKKAFKQQRNITDMLPDFSSAPVVNLREEKNNEIFDRGYFEEVAKQMSAAGKDFGRLKKLVVTINYLNRQKYYVDSAGSSYYQNPVKIEIIMTTTLQTRDGFDIEENSSSVYAAVKDIPPSNELIQKTKDFAAKAAAFYDAKKAESYIGPVWLEGSNAAYFFDDLFANKIKNTRPFWQDNDNADNGAGYLTKLLGLRVISNIFNVYDDPSVKEFKGKTLAGFYRVDDEGVRGKAVNLAARGKLIGLLTMRSLVKGQKYSNGHGRGSVFFVPRENPGNLFFEPLQTAPDMKKALMDECKKLDLEYCIKINNYGDNKFNGYKIYTKDGREEPVYGMETYTNTRSLRDIIFAGDDIKAYNIAPDYMPPYSIVTPSVIVGEVEIKPTEKKPSRPPMVPKP
ncbi:MAG: hypothetical protein LBI01_06260 [Elusimicrobium sp.]|jgi:hypothetical protein|nr:hypothetical protein [Elusimicrobium sp.]